jgi:hypothetical protein
VLQPNAVGVKNKRTGIKIMAAVQKEGANIVLHLQITNQTQEAITQLAVKLDNNPYKLQPINMSLNVPGVSSI